MPSDTSMASQLSQEEKIQLAIKALQDGTIPSQRKAALIYNVPRATIQQTSWQTLCQRVTAITAALIVQEEDSIKRCITTMTSWGWPVSIKYLKSLAVGLLHLLRPVRHVFSSIVSLVLKGSPMSSSLDSSSLPDKRQFQSRISQALGGLLV